MTNRSCGYSKERLFKGEIEKSCFVTVRFSGREIYCLTDDYILLGWVKRKNRLLYCHRTEPLRLVGKIGEII